MATTVDYLNNLVTQKNTLADNLVSKGVSATHDELLDTLVPKVLEISGQGGGDIENAEIIAYSLQEAGYDVTNDPKTWGEGTKAKWMEYDYRLDYSGVIFRYSGRVVTRNTDKLAYCGWCTFSGGYFMAVLVSAYPEALAITMGGAAPLGIYEFTVDERTVYWVACGENSAVSSDKSSYNRRYLGQKTPTGDEDIARKLYNEIKMLGYSLYE